MIRLKYIDNIEHHKVVWYRNPKECVRFQIERVNPTYKGFIWGLRKKSSKGQSWIKVGKIYFSIIPIAYGLSVACYLDMFTGYYYGILCNIGLFSCLFYSVIGVLVYLPLIKRSCLWSGLKS